MKKLGLLFVVVISLVFTVSCVSKEVPVTETYYETEYKTEYKAETYTETEDVVVSTSEGKTFLNPVSQWQEGIYLKASGSGIWMTYYYGYEIDGNEHARSKVIIKASSAVPGYMGVWDLTGVGQIHNKPGHLGGRIGTASGGLSLYHDEQIWFDNLNAILTDSKRVLKFQPLDTSMGSEISFDAEGIKEFAILVNSLNKNALQSVKLVWPDDITEKRTVTKERQVPYQVPVQVEKQRTVIQTKKVPFWEVWKAKPAAETPSLAPVPPTEESSPPPSPPITPEVKPPVTSPQLLYGDDFSNPKSGWTQASGEEGESYYKDGEFHGIVNKWDWASWQYNRNAGRFGDFTIEEDMRLVNGPSNSSYGLIFRCQDDNNFYRFLISANGNYLVGTKLDGKWTELQKWTMSEYVGKGNSTNHLKVVCKGSHIEVYVNEHYLTTVIDTSFAEGYIGGIIDTPEPNTHVAFDNFKVYSLD